MTVPMNRKGLFSPHLRRLQRGFTLLEILIVGALIALFSGIAIFAVQEMYDRNRAKAMFGEAYEIGTALSFAHNDLGFFPKLHLLRLPATLVIFPTGVYPSFDMYGQFPPNNVSLIANVRENWNGPYIGTSEARNRQAQGGRGLVTVRLSDFSRGVTLPGIGDASLVQWPTDTWGRPWVVYQVTTDFNLVSAQNPAGIRWISSPTELANYFNAVVSYGPNGVPGGLPPGGPYFTTEQDLATLTRHRLFTDGDLYGTGAFYTMKSLVATGEAALPAIEDLAYSLNTRSNDEGEVGILDPGSDDIIFRF